jgi:ankyrin repeat protein
VKPRSAAVDWLAISFDPWSAGKKPLNSHFISSLENNMQKIYGISKAKEEMDSLKLTANDGVLDVKDSDGLSVLQVEANRLHQLAEDFKKLTSLTRNAKFDEIEELVNQHDWDVPINYQDDCGNTILHIAAQNGNRRLIKFYLRRGADLNIQNTNGQTPLHFAYTYGYEKAGEYLVKKGADDSIRNKDGLTCYEGLSGHVLNKL